MLLLLLQLRHSQIKNELSWGLAAFTVESSSDLEAMRTALKDDIDYFEADLIGFTSIRALHDAAGHGPDNEFHIPYRALLSTQAVKMENTKGKAAKTLLMANTCMSGGEVDWSCIQEKVSIPDNASGHRLQLIDSTVIGACGMAHQHARSVPPLS